MAALKYEGPLFDMFNLGESETIQLKDLIAAVENALGKRAKSTNCLSKPATCL